MYHTDIFKCGNMALCSSDNPNRGLTGNTLSVRDYQLNIERALAKKLKASQREFNIDVCVKGGGTTITADAVTFELLKEATLLFYGDNIDKTTDRTGKAVVQYTIRPDSSYTVNIYTTTSRILVNGKSAQAFIESDLPKIYDIAKSAVIDGKPIDIQRLNLALSEMLLKAQTVKEPNIKTKAKLQRSLTDSNISSIPPANRVDSTCSPESIKYIKCKRNCRTNSLLCTQGRHWIHYRCQGLSPEEISKHEQDNIEDFTCGVCTSTNSNKSISLIIPKPASLLGSKKSTDFTFANEILTENEETDLNRSDGSVEVILECGVCESSLNGRGLCCEQCLNSCHETCAYTLKDTAICVSCFGLAEQNNQQMKTKEVKLKKLEDDLKLKDKTLKDKSKEHTRLMTHCEKLESRNVELEQTLQTITKRLEQLEGRQYGSPSANHNQYASSPISKDTNFALLNSIHERVTTFVLKQVDKQLQVLDESLPTANTTRAEVLQPSPKTNQTQSTQTTVVTETSNADFVQVPRNKLCESLQGQRLYFAPKTGNQSFPKKTNVPHRTQERPNRPPQSTHMPTANQRNNQPLSRSTANQTRASSPHIPPTGDNFLLH